ncbi:DMT family transporter [Paenibacillus faecis]|uniref:DMT family transporter n=1 Tax=Paenibacillus faecis TaxID=862114 RepID=UPI0020126240|nr:DMT family transporter [Paenibacillus faecis]
MNSRNISVRSNELRRLIRAGTAFLILDGIACLYFGSKFHGNPGAAVAVCHDYANLYSVVVFFVGGSVLLVYSVLSGFSLTNYDSSDWMYFPLLAIIPTIFGQYFFNRLLKSIGATTVSVGIIGEPVLAIILAYLFLGETISVFQLVGGLITLLGMLLYF